MPRGLVEGIIVKVNEFYFPVDFIVLNMKSIRNIAQILIILGRPFLATSMHALTINSTQWTFLLGIRKSS